MYKRQVFTNHHCGFSSIQQHSSVEHDYLKDGFVARSLEEELPNPEDVYKRQEGHFVMGRGAQKDWTIRMMQFFDYYLKGTKEPRWMKEVQFT